MKKLDSETSFDSIMRKFSSPRERIDECPHFGNLDDAPLRWCPDHNCGKQKDFCHARTAEKLRVLFGKTKGLDTF